MARRTIVPGEEKRRILLHEEEKRRIVADDVAARLGAEKLGAASSGSPVSFFALRQEIYNRLKSSGGRPSLEGTQCRPKIPMPDDQWKAIETIAKQMEEDNFHPTPGQVASALLSVTLKHFDLTLLNETKEETKKVRKRNVRYIEAA